MTPDSHSSSKRCWWLPTLSISIWMVFFLGLSLSNWRQVLISADGDPCLHWRIGKWMIEHRAVIRFDQFSHTRFEAPLVSKEWLGEVVFALAGNALGWNGIVLLAAVLIAATMWLLHRQMLSEGNEILLCTALVMVAAFASSIHWLARPHLATQLLTVIFAWRLRAFDRGIITRQGLFATLIPLTILWTNLHGAFFTGFVLIGVCLAAEVVDAVVANEAGRALARSKAFTLAPLLAACLLASLINPNGWNLHAQILHFLRTPALAGFTNEFRSPNFHSDGIRGFSLLLLVLAFVLLVARPRLRTVEILWIGVWGYLALHSARNIPIFALVVTPILASCLNQYLSQLRDTRWTQLYRKVSRDVSGLDRRADGRILAGIAVAALVAVVAIPQVSNSRPIIATEILTNRFPVAAVQFLHENKAPGGLHGEMFNDYSWGGYLMLYLPERKVFIDGRNDFYGEGLVNEFNMPDEVKPGWEDVFVKYHVGWTILPRTHPLCSLLALRADWKQVYRDDVAAIYARQPEETQNATH